MKVLMEHYAFIENPVWQNLYSQVLAQNAQPVQFFGYFGQQSTEVNDSRLKNLRHIVHQLLSTNEIKGVCCQLSPERINGSFFGKEIDKKKLGFMYWLFVTMHAKMLNL